MDTKELKSSRSGTTIDRTTNYKHTLASLQRDMSAPDRKLSRLIHSPLIETTSELLERTIMRPMAVAVSVWTALIVGLIFYLTARYYGFELSGSEILLGLIAGAIIGLVTEIISQTFRRR